MKKRLLICLIAVTTMVISVGCGDNGTNQQSQTGTNNNATEQTQTSDGTEMNKENLIGETKAKELALAKVDGATEDNIRYFDLDKDRGRLEYEGEIRYGGMEYEFEIDAQTGEFLKWQEEKEYD